MNDQGNRVRTMDVDLPKSVIEHSGSPPCSPAICSQCGKACGRSRLCRLRLYHKYISFLIDKELERISNAKYTRQATRKRRKTAE